MKTVYVYDSAREFYEKRNDFLLLLQMVCIIIDKECKIKNRYGYINA